MASVWKIARRGVVSSLTGEAFPPDADVVTALFGEEEEVGEDKVRGAGFVRRDYLAAEATPERLAGAFCLWRTKTPPATAERRRLDLDLAREFLERLIEEDDPARRPVALTLGLLLMRKRRLTLVSEGPEGLEVRWPRDTASFRLPAPDVTEADAEALDQEIQRLFDV
jgi:hypothetical protein